MYFFAFVALCAFTLPAAGYLYQRIGAHRDRRLYTSSGRWIDIGDGYDLYLLEQGSGSPTVVFESGIGATNLNWSHIQQSVSKFTHTVSYDRAGLGWSSRAKSVRTPGNIARELQTMLRAAGIKPPYILVGHSFGGLVMRRFALMYPEEITGIVLVDPMRPEEWPPFDRAKQATLERGIRMSRYAILIARIGVARLAITSLLCRSGRMSAFLAKAGGTGPKHVLSRIKSEVGKMPESLRPKVAAHWSRPSHYAGMSSHLKAVTATVREMQDPGPIQGIPVTLLTPGTSTPLCENGLRRIGDNVQQLIAPQCTHWAHLEQPELVIESISKMVRAMMDDSVAVGI